MHVQGASVFTFNSYNWKESLENLSSTDKAKYSFSNKSLLSGSSYIATQGCIPSDDFAKNGYVALLDGKYAAQTIDAPYVNNAGHVTHTIALNDTTFKRLCFLGSSSCVELIAANASDPTYGDRFFTNAFVLTEGTPNTIANPKPNRIAKSSISTDSAAPTKLWNLAQGGSVTVAFLHGYIDAQGWLCVKNNTAGNNLTYRFTLAT
ncbi:hypothetical protein VXR01_00275 [Acinetobacter baumannii]|uniref:hypothetical protein n=1 Tax=Acinetobacter baumannii TaxID=470 RepID=UPI003A869E3D